MHLLCELTAWANVRPLFRSGESSTAAATSNAIVSTARKSQGAHARARLDDAMPLL